MTNPTEIQRLSLDLNEARETLAGLRKERDALREALRAALEYGSMTGDDWVIDIARAALAQEQS